MEKFLLLVDLAAFAGVSAIFFSMAVAGKRAGHAAINVATVGNASISAPTAGDSKPAAGTLPQCTPFPNG
jgi:hypothetical protein